MFINRIGWPYYRLQKNYFWKVYYLVFGVPFMSSHLIYDLLRRHNVVNVGDTIIDIGCGNGVFLNQLSIDKQVRGIGLDRMSKRICIAQKVSNQNNLGNNFLVTDFEKSPPDYKGNVALLLDVMEHLSEPEAVIKNLAITSVSKIVIQTPYGQDGKYILKEEKFLYGHDAHIRTGFNINDLRQILETNGYKITVMENNFYAISQLVYEILELFRRRSRLIYALLWPFFYPLCWLDTVLLRLGRPNGIFVIVNKK
jgi:SAM-dependent methyltransferase